MASESGDSERFSESWEESAKKSFSVMDSKEADTIAGSQLEFYFQIIGENPSRSEVQAAISAGGKRDTDRFTFEECVTALKAFTAASVTSQAALPASEIMRVINQALDPNATGTFPKESLIKLMTGESPSLPTSETLTRDEMDLLLSELKISEGNTVQAADFFSLLLE